MSTIVLKINADFKINTVIDLRAERRYTETIECYNIKMLKFDHHIYCHYACASAFNCLVL